MGVNPGKVFESRFKTCLNRLPGASMRIEDGGAVGRNRQWGDFFYWDEGEDTYLFECKATHLKSFELRNLKSHQAKSLLAFSALRETNHSILALNFYDDDVRQNNRCVLIDIHDFISWTQESKRASLPLNEALEIGALCNTTRDGHWDLERALHELYV